MPPRMIGEAVTIIDELGNTIEINKTKFYGHVSLGFWTGHTDKDGYGDFTCKVNGKWRPIKAHRVAWMLERGAIPPRMQVLHKFDNPPCVKVEDLFLGTYRENIDDCVRKGRTLKGELHPTCRLTTQQALEAKRLLQSGSGLTEIGKRFGVSKHIIFDIKRGHSWAHVGGL